MRIIDVPSTSHIIRIEYNEETGLLEMEFKGGSIYNYPDVPSHVIDELEAAESKGTYAAANIYKQYPGHKL